MNGRKRTEIRIHILLANKYLISTTQTWSLIEVNYINKNLILFL